MVNRNDIIDGLAMLIASSGAADAHDGKEPQDDQYWYMVGYWIAKDQITPEEAIVRVNLTEKEAAKDVGN